MRDEGKVEEVRKRRVIPEAALWGSVCCQLVFPLRLLFQSQLDLESGDNPAQSVPRIGLPLAKQYA